MRMAWKWSKKTLRVVRGLFLVGAGAGATVAMMNLELLSPFGITSTSHDTQVIRALERTQEVSLISLGVQGIKEETANASVLGKSIPGTGKSTFIQYEFNANSASMVVRSASTRLARSPT